MVRPGLTTEVERQILAAIRAGGFAHVAAEAAGVSRRIFAEWMARGREKGAPRRYRDFWLHVIQAKAQARLSAELEARKKDSKFWLRYGPGAPCWRPAGKVLPRPAGLSNPKLQHLFALILQVLAPFPEARLAILTALELENEPPNDDPSTQVNISTPASETEPAVPEVGGA
jgi:hypothetical protein